MKSIFAFALLVLSFSTQSLAGGFEAARPIADNSLRCYSIDRGANAFGETYIRPGYCQRY